MTSHMPWASAGGRLRELREIGGISQRAVAAAAGVTQATVSRMETGTHEPAVLAAVRVCAALSVSVEAISGGDELAWANALALAAVRRTAVGRDRSGALVGVRRDRLLPGGPHSLFVGEGAFAFARVEVQRRGAVGLRTVVLARETRWLNAATVAELGARLEAVDSARCRTPTTLVTLSGVRDADERAAALLARLAGEGDTLVVVDERILSERPQTRDVIRAVFAHGRRTGCAINLLCSGEAPRWAEVNAAQVLHAETGKVGFSLRGSYRTLLAL